MKTSQQELTFTCAHAADRTEEAQLFYSLIGNFSHVLGLGECISKVDFINRFKQMYSLTSDADNRLKAFHEVAQKTNFLSISRQYTGELAINF